LVVWSFAVLGLVQATQNRLATFTSSYALWDDAIRLMELQSKPPLFAERQYNNRGNALVEAGYPKLGLPDVDRAVKLNDGLCAFHRNRAAILSRLKRLAEARVGFSRALILCPTDDASYFGRFHVEEALGMSAEATSDLNRACELGMQMACFVASRLKNGVASDQMFKFDIGSLRADSITAIPPMPAKLGRPENTH
jgi:tetratricopeptide (TPR) repeat protein